MKGFTAIAAFAAASLVTAAPSVTHFEAPSQPKLVPRASGSVVPITVKGNAFFQGDKRFYMRGVDYQPGGSSKLEDPIATEADCKRDIDKFKALGVNTVRIYTVDNSKPHDVCMQLLADAGIYLVLDVNTPKYSLNRADPKPSYNAVYLQNIFATIDAFAKYDNTLAFFSGNEVINDDKTTGCAPWIKAVTRDIRQYIGSRGYRAIPVGYSAADVQESRLEMAQYMNCGTDDERSDFFAFNDYSWCSPSTFQISGWDQKVKNFTGYGLPIFLSEYGCNTNVRDWGEVTSLYSTDMTAVYSGGLAYEYTMEENKYGIVKINSDGSVTELDDFKKLAAAFKATANPSGDGGYNKTGGASSCPAKSATWDVDNNLLPAMPEEAKKFMTDGAGTGVGLEGAGSHFASGTSTGTATPGSGSVTAVASGAKSTSSSSKSASSSFRQGPIELAPFVISAVVIGFTSVGAFLL